MSEVPLVPLSWVVTFVNEYAGQPRDISGEAGQPYPGLSCDGQPAVASRLDPGALAGIASAMWLVFGGADSGQKAAALNRMLRDADLTPCVTADGTLGWTTSHRADRPVLAAGCAVALLEAVGAVGWERLGICAGSDCVDVYVDQRGPTPRRYCSATCLNRARVRAYRERHRPRLTSASRCDMAVLA